MNSRNKAFSTYARKAFFTTFSFFMLTIFANGQTVIATQDFDGTMPDWGYSSDIPFFDNGTDGFLGIEDVANTNLEYASLMDSVLYERDLDDEGDNGTTGFANITFANIDVSGYTNVLLSFDYDIEGYNANNDEALYEIFVDGVGLGQVTLQDGETPGDDAEGSISEAIANGANMVSLVISMRNNGSSGWSAYDNFKLEGSPIGSGTEVSFSLGAADVDEDAGTYMVCVSIVNEGQQTATTVDVALVGGTATNGMDIDMYTTQTVTFPAGSNAEQCVSIVIVDDTEIDENETLMFELQNVTGGSATIGATSTSTVTIIDNDKLTCPDIDWTVVSPVPNTNAFSNNGEWAVINEGFSANGYCGGGCAEQVETWLVYGPLDMTGVALLELNFTAAENFGATTLDVQFSADSGANACPDEASWTSVGTIEDAGTYTFDFSNATGTEVFIAIEYNDDGADGFSDWDLTNFSLSADVCPAVGVATLPAIDAGADVVVCGVSDVTLQGNGAGVWSGGAGMFDDTSSPTAVYTPDASEEGSTVVLTYTSTASACTGFDDQINLTFFEEPGDAEFFYNATSVCPDVASILAMHTTGEDGTYTVTEGNAAGLALDPSTGEIDVTATIGGTYTVTNTIAGCGNLMISGVIDGPLMGGQPKAVELYALAYIPDLSVYGFGSANNGGGSDGQEYTFPADAVDAGTYIYLAANLTEFNTFFGFEPDYVDGAANVNGDDALEVFCNGQVVDVFGDINVDGNGETWEYLDGWAYRVSDTAPNAGSFSDADFTYSGANALDGENSNATANSPFPIGTFTSSQAGICPNSSFSFEITVGDTEPPVIDCPQDIQVGLDPGDCNAIVYYTISYMDNCGTIDGEMSQAINETLVNTALDCGNNTSNHLRYFDNNILVPVEISQVNFGIFNSGSNEVVTVNIYTIAPNDAFVYANMNLIATSDVSVPSGMNTTILNTTIEATIPVGMNYVLELKAANTQNFIIGYNNAGETESSFISGNAPVPCVSAEPTDIDNIGPFGGLAVILFSNAEAGPVIEQTSGLPSGVYYEMGITTNTFIVTDVNGNTSECSFDIEVLEYANPTSNLACNNNLNISMSAEDCTAIITADMILEGGPYGCYDDYIIEIEGLTGVEITQSGTYTVSIIDPDSGVSCWGTINVESKSAPVIEDCACPVGGTILEPLFEGSLDA
ncbi:MAG: Calx-beta domain-containing protein, partial [Saprospiraceae bacterium]